MNVKEMLRRITQCSCSKRMKKAVHNPDRASKKGTSVGIWGSVVDGFCDDQH